MSTTASSSTGSVNSTYASLIDQMISLESGPLTTVAMKQSQLTVTQGILSDIGTKMSLLRTALDGLRGTGSLSSLMAFTVTSANSQIVNASADSGASRGTHTVTVSEMAQAHMLGSGGFQSSGTGFTAGDYGFDVTVAGTTTRVNVKVEAGDTNSVVLSRISQAINSSGAAVSASVVLTNAGAGTQKLVLQSTTSGEANIISNIQDAAGGLAAQLGITGASSTSAYSTATLQQAKDAAYTLDGISMSSSTNEITGVLSGVTISLYAKSATPVSFTVSADTAAVKKTLQDYITKYNDLVKYLRDKSSVSTDGKTREALAGNSTFEDLKDSLRGISAGRISGAAPGSPSMLADLGIEVAQDGTLSLADDTKLNAAINANPAQVISLFASDNGVASRLFSLVDGFDSTNGGLTLEQRALSDQATSLTARKAELQARLDRRRSQLVQQFSRLQTMASQLSRQQAALSTITIG